MKRDCPEAENVLYSAGSKQHVRVHKDLRLQWTGLIGQEVWDILLDMGCSQTMVHADLVPPEKFLEGDAATIQCAHGDTVLYPLANIIGSCFRMTTSGSAAWEGCLRICSAA